MQLIYIVEDDKNIRELESYALKSVGYKTGEFESGEEFYEACQKRIPDLIMLDIMLSGEDGLTILKNIRSGQNTKNIPVIMVTAKSTELDKVKGFDLGADDYLPKPFGVMELVSRVKAILRRTQNHSSTGDYIYKDISIDDSKHVVTSGGNTIDLTYKEYELLKYLMKNISIVLSREKIMEKVWGFDYEGESRTVDMHIKTLRKKLGVSGEYIKTVRNVGYKLGD